MKLKISLFSLVLVLILELILVFILFTGAEYFLGEQSSTRVSVLIGLFGSNVIFFIGDIAKYYLAEKEEIDER